MVGIRRLENAILERKKKAYALLSDANALPLAHSYLERKIKSENCLQKVPHLGQNLLCNFISILSNLLIPPHQMFQISIEKLPTCLHSRAPAPDKWFLDQRRKMALMQILLCLETLFGKCITIHSPNKLYVQIFLDKLGLLRTSVFMKKRSKRLFKLNITLCIGS